MNTAQQVRSSPMVFRYFAAGLVALFAAFLSSLAALAYYGFPDAGSELLTATEFVSFAAITAGGFCFPALSRWFRSVVLLGFGLVFYCLTDCLRAREDYFLQMFPYPLFWPLVWGGCMAVALHCLVDAFQFITGWPDHALQPTPGGALNYSSHSGPAWLSLVVSRHHIMRVLCIAFCVALAGCSRQTSTSPAAPAWYSLSANERLVSEMTLAPQQVTNIVVQSTGKIVLGFKSDVSVSYAAQNRDTYVTLESTNTFGRVRSGTGAATRFGGSPEGIHLEVTSDFSIPVRVVIYQETTR